jgi:hypothetical protein
VNVHIREVAGLSGVGAETWAFLCECGRPNCRERVDLSLADYEEIRGDGKRVLAPGHALSRSELLRVQAQSLIEDARALRAQAAHQIRRTQNFLTR